jgi:IS30 family transposase
MEWCGGFIPSRRRQFRWALTVAERENISRGLATGSSLRQIAAQLRRASSTISLEIHRHGGVHRDQVYNSPLHLTDSEPSLG